MLLKAYFDGSGKFSRRANRGFLTLAGYAGRASAWDKFEPEWKAVLDKYKLGYFRSADAEAREGEFKRWSPRGVAVLRSELFEIRRRFFDGEIWSISCTVDIEGYRKAEQERQGLPAPTDLCGEYCVRRSVSLLQGQHLHLYFDRGEKFHSHLYRLWQASRPADRERYPWLDLIEEFGVAKNTRHYPGLQAADHLAWTTYRQLTAGDRGLDLQILEARGQYAHELLGFSELLDYESHLAF